MSIVNHNEEYLPKSKPYILGNRCVDMELHEPDEELKYQPGVCNIGPLEQRKRLKSGIAGLIFTIIIFTLMIIFQVDRVYRLLLFFPLVGTFVGFYQYYFKFCVAFAAMAKYHMR